VNTIGSYSCTPCPAGYEGDPRIACTNINDCAAQPCAHGGNCVDLVGGFDCECPPNWTGPTCGNDVDECATAANDCDSSPDACVNAPGSFACDCPDGYIENNNGRGEDGCIDIDECAGGVDLCDPLVECVNTPGSYSCGDCPPGYEGGGASGCTDIDECAAAPCFAPATCDNTPGSYTCDCPAGYIPDGAQGCIEIDECAITTPPCVHGACVDELNGYSCNCDPGWQGINCDQDMQECAQDPYPCDPNATCTDQLPVPPTFFVCTCNPGFVGDGQIHSDGTPGCVEIPPPDP
jgi:Notch-like protein